MNIAESFLIWIVSFFVLFAILYVSYKISYKLGIKKALYRTTYILLSVIFAFILSPFINEELFNMDLSKFGIALSFKGKNYSDNPKKISEMLHNKYPQIEIVWLFNDIVQKKTIVPDYVRIVKNNSLKARYELYTAKCWVDNFPKEAYEIKTKNQLN